MPNRTLNELGAIQQVVRLETAFMKEYEGQVLSSNDLQFRGRLQVKIPELHWTDILKCPWVEPEMGFGQVTPKDDDWVLVRFLRGNPDLPVYRGRSGYMADTKVEKYENPDTAVLYEDGDISLVYHRDTKILNLVHGDWTVDVDPDGGKADFAMGGAEFHLEGTKATLSLGDDLSVELSGDGKKASVDAAGTVLTLEDGKFCVEAGQSTLTVEDGSFVAEIGQATIESDGSTVTLDASGSTVELSAAKCDVCGNLTVMK